MTAIRQSLGVTLVLSLFVLTQPAAAQTILYGDSAELGNGIVYTWIEVDANNNPQRVALSFTGDALDGLSGQDPISLPLPQGVTGSLFKHVYIGWNPSGHDPRPMYQAPHFDFHFYIIDEASRRAIPGGVDPVPVDPQFLPPDYSFGESPFSVPDMGVHYLDLLSPEFQGQPFTTTMVLGYWQGDFIFYEPMITRDFLLNSDPDTTLPIRQPAAFQHEGYYPTSYSIVYHLDTDIYDISIGDFVFQSASGIEPERPGGTPEQYALYDNYPNPFNPVTTIEFDLPQSAPVTLRVFNVVGEEVAILASGVLNAGRQRLTFDGSSLASGIYLYRLEAPGFIETKRMLLVK